MEAKRNVLVLYDEPREMQGLKAIDRGIESELISKLGFSVEIYRETLDQTRFAGNIDRTTRDYFRQKYAAKKIEIIITVMATSLDFMAKYGEDATGWWVGSLSGWFCWMSLMNGLEVQSRLREVSPSTRVIIVTGKDDPLVRSTALGAGAFAFSSKPFDDEKFISAVGAALADAV